MFGYPPSAVYSLTGTINLAPQLASVYSHRMSKSNQLSVEIQNQLPPISPPCRSTNEEGVSSPRYNKFAEIIRKSTNSQLQCSMFCGGRKCKYDSPTAWAEKDRAIPALFSHWITNDILAMSRPTTEIVEQFDLISLFKQNGINTIINLQEPNEHANCGPPLDKSGFSYDPKTMMDNQIYFYNFHWKDFSGISPTKLLDIVKVMAFALSQGKVAIHCHAGLGRTGVLISAYLIYTYRCQAQSAINFVRTKRPHSVQSRSQILSLFKFANFISPCFIIYSQVSSTKLKATLPEYLQRQNLLLHGEELRVLRYIPKIVFVICEKLIQLCGKQKYVCHLEENFTRVYLSNKNYESFQTIKQSNGEKSDSDLEEGSRDSPSEGKSLKFTFENNSTLNDGKMELPKSDSLEMEEKYSNLIDSLVEEKSDECAPDLEANDELSPAMLSHHRPSYETIQRSLAKDCTFLAVSSHLVVQDLIDQPRSNPELSNQIFDYQKEINNKPTGWEKLCDESNVEMLCALLLSWFENLDIPVLHGKVARMLEASEDNALKCFFKLDKGTRYTLEYLSRFIIRLSGDEEDNEQRERLLWRVVASLTLKRVRLDTGELIPKEKPMWVELDNAHRIYDFIDQLIRIIINSNDI